MNEFVCAKVSFNLVVYIEIHESGKTTLINWMIHIILKLIRHRFGSHGRINITIIDQR